MLLYDVAWEKLAGCLSVHVYFEPDLFGLKALLFLHVTLCSSRDEHGVFVKGK